MTATARRTRRWPWILSVVLVVVVGAVWFALLRLDAFLLAEVRKQADVYAQRLGRPIAIGDISTRLFPSVGATVSEVSVGPAEDEGSHAPLAIARLEVDVAARPLLASRGKDLRVERAELTGVEATVIRFADDTTNVSRLLERWEQTAPPEEEPAPKEDEPLDLSNVHLARAALVDARITLIDQGGTSPQTWTIHDLDAEVRDVKVGKPLKVDLSAGILSEQKNLTFALVTAPLGKALEVVPESLVLKLEPLDLAPLGPFLAGSGLLGGKVQADLEATLGSAVPGGSGDTRVKGGLTATALRFEGAEGGKALDVKLDTDVTGDVAAGNLRLDTLVLTAGPAKLTGSGRLEGLMSESPRFEGFKLVGEGLDPEALAAYWPPLRKMVGGVVAGPIGLDVRGSGSTAQQSLRAVIDLTPVRLAIPDQVKKAAGAPMKLTASLNGAASGGGPLRFDADLTADGADLRPGALLDKAPGQRLAVQATGSFTPPKSNGVFVVDVSKLTLAALADTVTGTARYSGGGKTTDFAVDLRGDRLDVDALLLDDAEVAAAGGKVATPSDDPDRFDGYRGDIKLAVRSLRIEGFDLDQVQAQLKMVDDRIAVQQFSTAIFGGRIVADGSNIAMGPLPALRPFTAKVKFDNIDIAQVTKLATDKRILTGRFTGNVDFQGVGYSKDALMERLTGALQGDLFSGALVGINVLEDVTKPLAGAIPFAKTSALKFDEGTPLAADLPIGLTIQNGVAQLKKPITWTREGQSKMSFDGGMRLDGILDLKGRVLLEPAVISALTQGRVKLDEAVPLDLMLTGPAWKPVVSGLDVRPAAQQIIQQAAGGVAEQLLGKERTDALKSAVGGGVKEAQDKARQEAEQRAAAERARLEAEAKKRADAEKARLEQEAQKRLKGLFGK